MAQLWSAETVLDIHPGEGLTCCSWVIDKKKKRERPCQNPISEGDRELITRTLKNLSRLDINSVDDNILNIWLDDLAEYTSCKSLHRKQESRKAETAAKFRQRVRTFVARRRSLRPVVQQRNESPRDVALEQHSAQSVNRVSHI